MKFIIKLTRYSAEEVLTKLGHLLPTVQKSPFGYSFNSGL
jgi:hypothetical protein